MQRRGFLTSLLGLAITPALAQRALAPAPMLFGFPVIYGTHPSSADDMMALLRPMCRCVEECGPGLYRYIYSDDPTCDVLAPSHSGAGGLGGNSEADREEPVAMKSATGPAGGARAWGQA